MGKSRLKKLEVLLLTSFYGLCSHGRYNYNNIINYDLLNKKSSMKVIIVIYRVSQEECARLRESVPYVKLYRYNPKHLYPNLNGYGDNGQRNLKL